MESTIIHICLETEGAPTRGVDREVGERWVCACGDHFVYREGFNRSGHASLDWWPAPAVPRPRRSVVRGLLFGPRKG
ncbi:hypothetical protein HN031_04040 [Nocardioides sp. zg-1308]|uniref:hypothetical protein n=1 Tax=Nocardioides TaxID=1839 RepID=UPI00155659E7|nr:MULTISPECIES: hypothetical protein [unclassified Nocardioides]NPD03856.1 hypothetical protein [Nocardioides sp. zg-1308]WQQ21734.1 hypothetical protein SHK17_17790 [Nocardioides sp. S-34]